MWIKVKKVVRRKGKRPVVVIKEIEVKKMTSHQAKRVKAEQRRR